MSPRLPIAKTYKLFIGGKFPRSESGRSMPVAVEPGGATVHLCMASRKDLRDAVEAAREALPKWSGEAPGGASAMLRSQILYRVAEMMEGKRDELAAHAGPTPGAPAHSEEVAASIDRLVHYAGWCDKYQQVLGCSNPVAGAFYNFTIPEPVGVVAVVCPDELSLLPLISLLAPVLAAGNTAVVIAPQSRPIPACILGEACATGDVPGGVVNILTGHLGELVPQVALHRGIDAIHSANLGDDHARTLRLGAAENLKRVVIRSVASGCGAGGWFDAHATQTPWWIEPFTDMKTVWHPSGA